MNTAKTLSPIPHLQRFSGDWQMKRLQEISDINPQNVLSNTNPDYKFNYISLEHVDKGSLLGYSEEVFRTAPSRAQRILQHGDVLMSTVRPNLMAHLFFHDQVPNAVCSTGFAVLRAKCNLSAPYFLFVQLFSQSVNDQITKIIAGSNYPAINSRDIIFIEIPCPPQICEQHAIAKVLSDVNGLIGALDALIAKKRAIKQATMQQLLTGKARLPGFSGEWEARQLRELGTFKKGRGIKRDEISYEGLPCIRYGELYTRYQDYILKLASRIPPTVAATALPIRTGDLLFAGSGETAEEIGRCAAYVGKEKAYAGGDIIVLTASGQNSIYLGHLMNHPIVSVQKTRMGQGDAVVHISTNNLAQIQIKLPPIAEQNTIATVLSDMDAEIVALEERRDKTRAIKRGMMQQLLTGRVRLVKSGAGTV